MIQRIVVRVGGASFFTLEGIPSDLSHVLRNSSNAQIYLVVGRGDIVESTRTIHRIFPMLNAEDPMRRTKVELKSVFSGWFLTLGN